jgi:hypothetical protein
MSMIALPTLRPLSIGQLLDQAIRLYRHNFVTFVGILAVVLVPLMLLQMVVNVLTLGNPVDQFRFDPSGPVNLPATFMIGMTANSLITLVSFIMVQGLATAVLTRTIAGTYFGEQTGVWDAYRQTGNSWISLLAALLLTMLVSLVLSFYWLFVPCVGWLTGLGILMFLGLAIMPLLAPLIILEKQPAARALRRAWDLARRRFWWVLGFVLVLFLFNQLVVTAPVTLVTAGFQLLYGSPFQGDGPAYAYSLQMVTQSLVTLISTLIYVPLQLTGITLMYIDLRVRTEGVDLALLATAEPEASAGVAALARPAAVAEGGLVTAAEMGNFFLVSLIAVVGLTLLMVLLGGLGLLGALSGGAFGV